MEEFNDVWDRTYENIYNDIEKIKKIANTFDIFGNKSVHKKLINISDNLFKHIEFANKEWNSCMNRKYRKKKKK